MGKRNKEDGRTLCRNQNDRGTDRRACGAHPGAERRPMGSRFMLGMVVGVFCGSRLGYSAADENTEYQ
ncbi:MAG: hypothetical protein CV089_09795 [Nitrospira sp. WS110]|nr:hypothetical protein [Nitrospira sp. WS110]